MAEEEFINLEKLEFELNQRKKNNTVLIGLEKFFLNSNELQKCNCKINSVIRLLTEYYENTGKEKLIKYRKNETKD